MKVQDVMKAQPRTCTPDTTVAEAAHLMWDADCGVLPVVDDGELVGVVTDRDMYIALATQNERAAVLRVGAVATTDVVTCQPEDDVQVALATMQRARVRRLPVVGQTRTLMGILSLNDIIRALGSDPTLRDADVVDTLKAICARTEAERPVMPAVGAESPAPDVKARTERRVTARVRAAVAPVPARRRNDRSQGRTS